MSSPAELEEQEAAEREAAELAERDAGEPLEGEGADVDEISDEAAVAAAELEQSTYAQAEETNKQLDRVESYLTRKYEEIFGAEAADLEWCPLCTWSRTWGKVIPRLPPEEVREAVKRAIGLGTLEELHAVPQFQTCQVCGGYCNVLTGAKAGDELYRECPNCGGRGYTSSLPLDQAPAGAGTPVVAAPVVDGAPPQSPDFDEFGTPRGHPDYGRMVQHRKVPISEWAGNLPTS